MHWDETKAGILLWFTAIVSAQGVAKGGRAGLLLPGSCSGHGHLPRKLQRLPQQPLQVRLLVIFSCISFLPKVFYNLLEQYTLRIKLNRYMAKVVTPGFVISRFDRIPSWTGPLCKFQRRLHHRVRRPDCEPDRWSSGILGIGQHGSQPWRGCPLRCFLRFVR